VQGEIARQVFFSMGDWDSKTVVRYCDWAQFRYCEERLIDQEGVCWYWTDWGRSLFKCFVAPRDGYRSRYPSRPYSDSYPRDAARNGFDRRYPDDGDTRNGDTRNGDTRNGDTRNGETRRDGDARRGGRWFPYQSQRPNPEQRPEPEP
jgi:hypothetical protein